MEGNEGQLKADQHHQLVAPKSMRKSALGRAIFGFYCETHDNAYFVNDNYIQQLCNTQNQAEANYGKTLIFAFVLSILSIATANNAISEASYLGLNFSQIPFLTEFCSLTLGVVVSLLVFQALDVFAIARMRHMLFSLSGSENPNMRMLHFKGNGAWVDALIPKTIGYQSSKVHRLIQLFGLCWSLMLPVSTILLVLAAQAICISSVLPIKDLDLSDAIVWIGIIVSVSSILVLVLTAFIPLKFTLNSRAAEENLQSLGD